MYAKNTTNAAMHLEVLQQNIPLLWQLINHKHIVSIPEFIRCHTIIISRGTKVVKMLTLAPERYTAGFCMIAKVILWCI